MRGHREGGLTARSKNFKMPFFKRYWKILSRGYSNGSRTSPFFSFLNISTNMVSRDIQNFSQNRPWQAGWLSNGKKFYLKLAQTCDEQRILAIAQSACLPWPISTKTLDASSNHICWDISKRNKNIGEHVLWSRDGMY